jgi:transcription elongation factor Elf1
MPLKRKSVVVTFRVDAHLAEALDRIPDKSAFIREALQSSLHETCPACNGVGRVDCDAATWLGQVLKDKGARTCACCGTAFPPAMAAAAAPGAAGAAGSKDKAEKADRNKAPATCGHCGPDGHRH